MTKFFCRIYLCVFICNSCGYLGEIHPSDPEEGPKECKRARDIRCGGDDEFVVDNKTTYISGYVHYEPQSFGTKLAKDCVDEIDDMHKSSIIRFSCLIRSGMPSTTGSLEPNSEGELTCGTDEHSVRFNPATAEMRLVTADGIFKFKCSDMVLGIE